VSTPPGNASNELRRLAGLKCRCELRALLASKGDAAAAAAAALLALTCHFLSQIQCRKSRSVALASVLHCAASPA
jgi:hypothetical protein